MDIQYDRVTDPFRVPLVPSDRLENEKTTIHTYINIFNAAVYCMVAMETIATVNQIRRVVQWVNRITISLQRVFLFSWRAAGSSNVDAIEMLRRRR